MKKLNKKKGFTIVELVIVIAVVGVLTAVLVPTFVNLTNQARKAENQTFVKNLNTQMAIREATEGKNKTMYEAMMEAEDIGFNVEKLTPVDGNDIVWDEVANRFAIVDKDYVTNKTVVYSEGGIKATSVHKLWKIYDSLAAVPEAEAQTYSVYAKEGWDLTGLDSKVFTVGFDAGKNKTIGHETKYARQATPSSLRESISGKAPRMLEENGQEVTIRTTGGTLNVDAPADAVRHYGEAQVVTLTSVADSYENGSVNLVDIKKGRFVITNDEKAEVGTIYLTATDGSYDGIILATMGGSALPELVGREEVALPTGEAKKLVVTIQTNVDANGENPTKTEEIYLYSASDVKEATNGYNVSDLGLLVVEAISSEAQTQAAKQITDAAVLESVTESKVSTKEKVVAIATVFAGGKGTKDKPYLISNRQELENISKVNENYVSQYDYACDLYYGNISTLENESLSGNWSACVDYVYGDNNNYSKAAKANNWSTEVTGGYFKVADGVKEIDCSDWTSGILYGHFDGNGVVLNNLNAALFNTVYDYESNIVPFEVSTISNLTANVNIRSTSRYFEGFITNLGWSTSFKNVVLHGYIEAQNAASFVGLGTGYSGSGAGDAIVISFDNCYSDISLVSVSGFSSGFVAHPYWGQGSKMVINDSIYYGRATSTSGNHYYKGNSSNDGSTSLEETYTDGFFGKYGFASIENLRGTSKTLSANYAVSNKSTTLTVRNDLTKPELGSVFTVNQANGAVKAVAKFVVGPNDVNEKGNYTGVFLIDENLTASNGQFITENVKYYTVTVNGDSTEETGVSGTNFNIVRGSYGTTYTTYMVEIVQYDTDGNIICINRCDLH